MRTTTAPAAQPAGLGWLASGLAISLTPAIVKLSIISLINISLTGLLLEESFQQGLFAPSGSA